jgi:hypothetical protein
MNIYGKLAAARAAFHRLQLKKSGKNTFAGYTYFELADFLIPGMQVMTDAGLVPVVSFESDKAVMRIFEIDGGGVIEIQSPRAEAQLKGCHPIQNLGAEETYQRRYLWMAALEIVEHDAVDASQGAVVPLDLNAIYQAETMEALQAAFAAVYKAHTDTASRKVITGAKDRRKQELSA